MKQKTKKQKQKQKQKLSGFFCYNIIIILYMIKIPNRYLKDKNQKLIWLNENDIFMKNNYPSKHSFDYNIKKDILEKSLLLPINSCIIDCGAHIGDGSIPIAHYLKYSGREDIMVYAIDPSKYKCDFINNIIHLNNLKNISVINCGLSKENDEYELSKDWSKIMNTGGMTWKEGTGMLFDTLDNLVKNKVINHNVGILHLDVEGMEIDVLKGAKNTLLKDKPYLTIENNNRQNIFYEPYLPEIYKFNKLINQNQTFIVNPI